VGSPIATNQQVVDRAPVAVDQAAQTQLSEIVQAATDAIEAECNRVFVQQIFTKTYDGDRHPVGRWKDRLYLYSPPVAESPMPVVTENGIAISVTASYDAAGAYGAILIPDEGLLIRQGQAWETGLRNIVATYTGGFATLPADIVSACVELTWLLYRVASKSGGWDSYSTEGASAQAIRDLSAPSKAAIARHTLWGRP